MFPQPQQLTPEAGSERPFNADARDAGRFQQQPAPVQMQGQFPQQQPAMAPQAQMPYAQPGVPASPYPQGQPNPLSPGAMAAFGLPVPPIVQTPQQPAYPQQMPFLPQQQQPQQSPMNWFQQGLPQQQPSPQQQVPPPVSGQQAPQMPQVPQQPVQQQPSQPQPTEQMSAWIQQQSEAAYGTALFRAMNEPDFLERLTASQNPMEQQLARKVLERNAEHFGAGTVEEYQAKLELDRAGSDPVKQELARVKMQQVEQSKQMQQMQWNAWKATNGIKDDAFGQLTDAVRKEFPNATPADVVHIARGRSGINPQQQMTIDQQQGINPLAGGGSRGGQPSEQGVSAEGMALFGLTPQLQNQTESYMRTVGAIR